MVNWRNSINQVVGADRIRDISGFVRNENYCIQKSSIDSFYEEIRSVLSIATPSLISQTEGVGAFLAVAIVSFTENYFRDVFCRILNICPQSHTLASLQSINLGSVIWHPEHLVIRGAFEHISLASAESIAQTSKKYIGVEIKSNTGMKAILEEFDKVCELRHGIVHSGRILAGKNAIKLQIPSSSDISRIHIDYANLQEISSICTTLVVSSNNLLFEAMCERWATSWRNLPSWNPTKEKIILKNVWNTFYSLVDERNDLIQNKLTFIKCRNAIKREYNLN